jgi:hypothetical protein
MNPINVYQIHIATVSHFVHGALHCVHVLIFQMDFTNLSENVVKLTNFSMARVKDSSNADNGQIIVLMRYMLPLKIDFE